MLIWIKTVKAIGCWRVSFINHTKKKKSNTIKATVIEGISLWHRKKRKKCVSKSQCCYNEVCIRVKILYECNSKSASIHWLFRSNKHHDKCNPGFALFKCNYENFFLRLVGFFLVPIPREQSTTQTKEKKCVPLHHIVKRRFWMISAAKKSNLVRGKKRNVGWVFVMWP